MRTNQTQTQPSPGPFPEPSAQEASQTTDFRPFTLDSEDLLNDGQQLDDVDDSQEEDAAFIVSRKTILQVELTSSWIASKFEDRDPLLAPSSSSIPIVPPPKDMDSRSLLASEQTPLQDPSASPRISVEKITLSSSPLSPSSRRMIVLTALSALGGFLFGYDTGVVSGALPLLRDEFSLSDFSQEVCVSSTIFAAALSALWGGQLNASYGRRLVILFASCTFAVGSLLMAFAPNFGTLVAGRLIVGVGIGFASLTTPMYIAEVAKPEMRGRLVTINTFFICSGQFIAGMVDGVLADVDNGWRYMLGLALVPSVVMGVGFLTLPESPRWLLMNGRRAEAIAALVQIRDGERAALEEVDSIESALIAAESVSKAQGGLGDDATALQKVGEMVRHPPTRRALVLGCGLMALQQFVGINTVMYYAASIYETAGFDTDTAIWLSGFTALAQVLGLVVSIYLIERAGRRTLLLGSLGSVIVFLVLLGASFLGARVSSGDVGSLDEEGGKCSSQDAAVWSGDTEYCFDCGKFYCDQPGSTTLATHKLHKMLTPSHHRPLALQCRSVVAATAVELRHSGLTHVCRGTRTARVGERVMGSGCTASARTRTGRSALCA